MSATAAFAWSDPLRLDDQLTELERLLRDAAARFAADRLQPRIEQAYLDETVDAGIFAELGAAGLLGITVPEEYGGLGASYVAYGLVAREIERVEFRLSLQDERAVFARHPPHPGLWQRGSEAALSSSSGLG